MLIAKTKLVLRYDMQLAEYAMKAFTKQFLEQFRDGR